MGRIAGLTILPLVAHTSGRELLIGAYDLNNRRAGFQVGLLLILVATSIVDTAYIAQKYGQERLRETLVHLFVPSWGWILLGSVTITNPMKISAPSHQRRCLAMMQALATLAQKDLGHYQKTSFRALSEAPCLTKARRLTATC